MELLSFQLHAPMASWGGPAVGEFRGTDNAPTESAVFGMLAAALGIKRSDDVEQERLRDGYNIAIAMISPGSLLRDYHTIQFPKQASFKNHPHATRRDELSVGNANLTAMISKRDYITNSWNIVALQARDEAPYTLTKIADALRRPRFVLYLGRKSCPPDLPLDPVVLQTPTVLEGACAYLERAWQARVAVSPLVPTTAPRIERLTWGRAVEVGCDSDLSVMRKDQSVRRSRWQFRDRNEHQKLHP